MCDAFIVAEELKRELEEFKVPEAVGVDFPASESNSGEGRGMSDKEIIYFWAGVIWTTIGFGGAMAIATVMRFFETPVNLFLALLMVGWVLFWINSGKIWRFSYRVSNAIAKQRVKEES